MPEQSGDAGSDQASPSQSMSASPSQSMSATTGSILPDGYIGPDLAFDVPADWHEFFLSSSWDYLAAYGPIEAGDTDYVAVGPLPPGQGSAAERLEQLIAGSADPADIEVAQSDGTTLYSITWTEGSLTRRAIVVEGDRDIYLANCQHTPEMEREVSAGCDSILGSLHEVPPSPVTDPSGCSNRELAILATVPEMEGTTRRPPDGERIEEGCDVWVDVSPDTDADVTAFYDAALGEVGWITRNEGVVRTGPTGDVHQLFALMDWDVVLIEAYVTGAQTDHYFITVIDG